MLGWVDCKQSPAGVRQNCRRSLAGRCRHVVLACLSACSPPHSLTHLCAGLLHVPLPVYPTHTCTHACKHAGTKWIDAPNMAPICRSLGVDYAPALVGFEVQGGRMVPRIRGVVICEVRVDEAVLC